MNYRTEYSLFLIWDCIYHKVSGDRYLANRIMDPLTWYISTGRCCGAFVHAIDNITKRQISTIANRLIKAGGGNYEESIKAVTDYIRV